MKHPGVRKLQLDENNFAILKSTNCKNIHSDVKQLINLMGIASSQAQGLNHVITTYESFISSPNKIYMLCSHDHTTAFAFLKVGYRNLFLWDPEGQQHELKILCLLDFFTHPNCQRKGYGKQMIDKMLQTEHLEMQQIPIDKPSNLCFQFMKKHFGLENYIPQSNNFVVFDQFWLSIPLPPVLNQRHPSITPKIAPSKFGNHVQINQKLSSDFNPKPKIAVPKTQNPTKLPQINPPSRHHGALNPITWLPY